MEVRFQKIYRECYGRLLAGLIAYFGLDRIGLAEDIVQDTFVAALEHWRDDFPERPDAWLFRVCKHKALNALRRRPDTHRPLSLFDSEAAGPAYRLERLFMPYEIRDNQLRIIFALCHPSLPPRTQLVLVLRIVAGFRTREIARGLGLGEEAVKKIFQRGKKRIRDNGIPLRSPFIFKSKSRLATVHKVLYLIFNEGYRATSGDRQIKQELCIEAASLARVLIAEQIHDSSTHALLATMLFHMARFPARLATDGSIIDLESQDRSRWDATLLRAAFGQLRLARRDQLLSRYHLEAGIASLHASAPSLDATDWPLILRYYDQLCQIADSPFVQLNRCIAKSYCEGPAVAIDLLEADPLAEQLSQNVLYQVTLGKLYQRMDRKAAAKDHFAKGLQLAQLESERQYIGALLRALQTGR